MAATVTIEPRQKSAARTATTAPMPRHRVWTTREVAALSAREIEWMSEEEMAEVILSVRRAHLRDNLDERLAYLDRPTLTRLMFVTRRYCQNLRR